MNTAAAAVQPAEEVTQADLPPVGTQWQGGLYAGKSIHNDTAVALILLPGENAGAKWGDASKWAADQQGELPSRIDGLVLLANLKAEFKEEWYWTGAPDGADYAWYQSFNNGNQNYWNRNNKLRARAVRRWKRPICRAPC